ncbi:MAG TPA: hypothetical protein VHW92_02655 [Mycobacteriales bacterium]|jgi:hypothetical protein|nr:hypothetical protein [Mycobacteriales bacterium]
MEESVATEVVELLRARDFFAHVNRRAGVYSVGVRLVIPGGREVIWDNDGASGLEAMVLLDGDLVGFVPQIANSDDLSAAQVAEIIASTDYDAPPAPSTRPSLSDHVSPETGVAPPAPGTSEASAAASGRAADEAARSHRDGPGGAGPTSAEKHHWTDRLHRPR